MPTQSDKRRPRSNRWMLLMLVQITAVLLANVNKASSSRLASVIDPNKVGNFLGSIWNAKKQAVETFGRTIGLNVNLHPQQTAYQYNPENYQYGPPPAPSHMQEGYYPYGPGPNYFGPGPGYNAAGYYPVGPASLGFGNQHRHYPENYHYSGPAYLRPHPETPSNPYMRPTDPPQLNMGQIMGSHEKYNMPPLTPIGKLPKIPKAGILSKPGIITPDSPLYVHIPEDRPTLDIEPRRR